MKAQIRGIHLRQDIVVFFLLLFFVVGCAHYDRYDHYHYEQAQAIDTIGAYEEYLSKFPKGRHRTAAFSALDDLTFRRAETLGSIIDYRQYLSKFPKGRHKKEALATIDDLTFRRAEIRKTISAYDDYVRLYGVDGAHSESALWRLAQLKNKKKAFVKFCRKFPYSANKIPAKAKIAYFNVMGDQSIESLTYFFQLFHRYYPNTISDAEYKEVLALLKKLAKEKQRPEFNILLYNETRKKEYLKWGLDYRHKVLNEKDEAIFASHFPQLYFELEACKLQKSDDDRRRGDGRVVPIYECSIRSKADFGNYLIKLNLTADLTETTKYFRYYSPKDVKRKREKIFQEKEIFLSKKSQKRFSVAFPPILSHKDKKDLFGNGKIIERGVDGIAKPEFLDINLQKFERFP